MRASNGLIPTTTIIARPVIGSVMPIGQTSFDVSVCETRVAKFACCGSAPPMAPMNENANVGPNATIAPRTCRNSSHGNNQARSVNPLVEPGRATGATHRG